LSCLKGIYDILQVDMPSVSVIYDVNIACGHVACKLGNYELSVAATITALRQMNEDIKGVSAYDKLYLRYYCKRILEFCSSKMRSTALPPDVWPISVDYTSLQREKVRPDILRNFPITKPTL